MPSSYHLHCIAPSWCHFLTFWKVVQQFSKRVMINDPKTNIFSCVTADWESSPNWALSPTIVGGEVIFTETHEYIIRKKNCIIRLICSFHAEIYPRARTTIQARRVCNFSCQFVLPMRRSCMDFSSPNLNNAFLFPPFSFCITFCFCTTSSVHMLS